MVKPEIVAVVAPLLHAKLYGVAPPDAPAVAEPSLPPLMETLLKLVINAFNGGEVGLLDILMSSTPINSSEPEALVVIMRSCTSAWLLAAAGNVTSIGKVADARFGPVEASATYPAGKLVQEPVFPTR